MTLLFRLWLALFAVRVGADSYGNAYYQARLKKGVFGRLRRYCLYKGQAEGSKVPAAWHLWMHYQVNEPPKKDNGLHGSYKWQTFHKPDLTGTKDRYLPANHPKCTTERKAGVAQKMESGAHYQPWTPGT